MSNRKPAFATGDILVFKLLERSDKIINAPVMILSSEWDSTMADFCYSFFWLNENKKNGFPWHEKTMLSALM